MHDRGLSHTQDLYGRFTLDTAIDFLFGAHIDSLVAPADSPSPTIHGETSTTPTTSRQPRTERASSLPFVTAFNEVQRIVTKRLRLGPIWPLFELGGSKTAPHMEVINVGSFILFFLFFFFGKVFLVILVFEGEK